jgi:hypothetical protein
MARLDHRVAPVAGHSLRTPAPLRLNGVLRERPAPSAVDGRRCRHIPL